MELTEKQNKFKDDVLKCIDQTETSNREVEEIKGIKDIALDAIDRLIKNNLFDQFIADYPAYHSAVEDLVLLSVRKYYD